MNLSKEIRVLSAILLIVTILLIGTTTLYFSKSNELQQTITNYNQNLENIETYCDINFTQINETLRQQNLKTIINNSNQIVTNQ